jgi:hypothetical protein
VTRTLDRDWVYTEDQARDVPARADTHPPDPAWHGVRSTDHNPLGRWEYTKYERGTCELYDLTTDPWELRNVCNDPAYVVDQRAAASALDVFESGSH